MPLFEYSDENQLVIDIYCHSNQPLKKRAFGWLVKVVGLRTTGRWPDRVLYLFMVIGCFVMTYMNKDMSYLERQDQRASAVLQVNVLCDKEVPATCSLLKDMCEQDKSLCEELGLP